MKRIILTESQIEKIFEDIDNGSLTPYTPEQIERNYSFWTPERIKQQMENEANHAPAVYRGLAIAIKELGLNMLAYAEADPKQANRVNINKHLKTLEGIILSTKKQLGYIPYDPDERQQKR